MFTLRINVSLTDEKVLSVIREKLGEKPGKLTLQDIADLVGCHRITAHRSLKRLQSAGRLRSEYQGFSKPCIYEVLNNDPQQQTAGNP